MLQSINSQNPSFNNIEENMHQMNSLVEKTIRDYYPIDTPDNVNRPLVKIIDSEIYSKNSANDYVSRFTDGVNDCLGCGSSIYFFQFCLEKDILEMKRKFFQDL